MFASDCSTYPSATVDYFCPSCCLSFSLFALIFAISFEEVLLMQCPVYSLGFSKCGIFAKSYGILANMFTSTVSTELDGSIVSFCISIPSKSMGKAKWKSFLSARNFKNATHTVWRWGISIHLKIILAVF